MDSSPDSNTHAGSVALIDQVVASATNFLTGVIVGRVCAEQQFGLYMLGLSIVLLAMRLQGTLITTPYMIYCPRLSGITLARYTGSSLSHQVGFSILTVFTLIIGGLFLSAGIGPKGLDRVLWALVLSITFILLRDFARQVGFSHLEFVKILILDLAVAVIQILAILSLAYFGLLSAYATFWIIGIACGVSVAFWFCNMRKSISLKSNQITSDFKLNWDFGKWVFAGGFLWEMSISMYPWILTYFHGTAATGIWAACFGVVAIGNPMLLGMKNFLGPKIAYSFTEGDSISLRRLVFKSCAMFSLLLLPFSISIWLFGDKLVALFYGEKYGGHGLVVSLLAIELIIAPARFAISRALLAMEHAALDFVTNICSFLVLVTFGIWMVKENSVVGVAFGILFGGLAVLVAKLFVFIVLIRTYDRDPVQ